MKNLTVTSVTTALLGLALATSAVAQQAQENFPKERTQAGTCADVNWNEQMVKQHPGLIDACQEVILVDGKTWARFDAKFVRVNSDGSVIFSVRDKRDRSKEEVILQPAAGQVAYLDDRPTPFARLRSTDKISLYVPEGRYGFATQPGVAQEQLAQVIDSKPADSAAKTAPVAVGTDRTVAQRDTTPSVLPATATSLPWLALAGLMSLLGGMLLTLRRWS